MSNEAEALNLPGETQKQTPQLRAIKDSEVLAEAQRPEVAEALGKTEEKAKKSQIEVILETVDAINDLKGLEALAYSCHKKGLLTKMNLTEVKWKVEAIEGMEGSEKLVKAIMQKQKILLNKLFEAIGLKKEALKRIEDTGNADELDILAWTCHKKGLVKKVFTGPGNKDWKVEAIEGVVGSNPIVKAIMAKKKEFEDQEFTANIVDIGNKYGNKEEGKRVREQGASRLITRTGDAMSKKEAYREKPNGRGRRFRGEENKKVESASNAEIAEFMRIQERESPVNSIGDTINPDQVSRLSKRIKKERKAS
jgi:hypothetical protein